MRTMLNSIGYPSIDLCDERVVSMLEKRAQGWLYMIWTYKQILPDEYMLGLKRVFPMFVVIAPIAGGLPGYSARGEKGQLEHNGRRCQMKSLHQPVENLTLN